MTNESDYQVTFSYDKTQTGRTYDSYIKKIGEKYGAIFENDKSFEDDYGARDITFSSITDFNKFSAFIKETMQDLGGKNAKLTASGAKCEYLVKINQAQIKETTAFTAFIQGWAQERNVKVEDNGVNIELSFPNKVAKEEFKNNALPNAAIYTKNFQAINVEEDNKYLPSHNSNNYTEKKPRM